MTPFGMSTSGAKVTSAILASVFVLALSACGGQESVSNDAPQDSGKRQTAGTSAQNEANRVAGETTRAEATASERGDGVAGSGEIAELAKAEVGLKEITNMIPADGEKPDPGRQLPKDPPEGIKVYPATINRSVRGPIEYDREPPTNGNHAPLWQNCGFYKKPVQNRYAVHSLDHGVVWITYLLEGTAQAERRRRSPPPAIR